MIIYTTGYAGEKTFKGQLKVATLRALLNSLNGQLFDIRFRPTSKAPCWRKHNLAKVLGEGYTHVRDLGNEAYATKGEIRIHDWQAGLKVILACRRPPALLCACPDYAGCHREVVARALIQMGHEVIEIAHWGQFLRDRDAQATP